MTARRMVLFTAAIATVVSVAGGAAATQPAHPGAVQADSGWQAPVPAMHSASVPEDPAVLPGDDSGWQ
ncbi:hypothetical protein [Streptomyces sp. OR43]|uniref:hypothetical protein n=1 Tax=Streptomyces sp. or43 TaxID=2478957 RepID=UPI0016513CF1|nr:hypothetical protein [Streptomyces sp. or43]